MTTIRFSTDNGPVEITLLEVADKLGIKLSSSGTVAIVRRNEDSEIYAQTDAREEDYPSIDVHQVVDGIHGMVSVTELPNEDNDQIMTYLYAGNDETETDDWIACLADGYRAAEDNSRRLMYIDNDLVATASSRRMDEGVAFTELQYEYDCGRVAKEKLAKKHSVLPEDNIVEGKTGKKIEEEN